MSCSEAVLEQSNLLVKTSWDVHAAIIIVLTQTGTTARNISKYRPIAPVLAVTSSAQVGNIYLIKLDNVKYFVEFIHFW